MMGNIFKFFSFTCLEFYIT